MVVLEVGIDAQGAVRGGQQATAAFSRIADSAAFMLTAIGGANSAMGKFGAILARTQPWLVAITAVLSGVGMAMQLLSEKTKKATTEWDEFGKAMRRLPAEKTIEEMFNVGKLTSLGRRDQIKTLFDRAVGIQSDSVAGRNNYSNIDEFASSINANLRGTDIISDLYGFRGRQAEEFLTMTGGAISPQDQIRALQRQAQYLNDLERRDFHRTAPSQKGWNYGMQLPGYPPSAASGDSSFSLASAYPNAAGFSDMVSMSPERQKGIDIDINTRNMQARMAEIEDLSRRIGDNLGDAAFDFVAGLRDGRDVMASILIDIGRSLSREAIGSLTKNIISQFG